MNKYDSYLCDMFFKLKKYLYSDNHNIQTVIEECMCCEEISVASLKISDHICVSKICNLPKKLFHK